MAKSTSARGTVRTITGKAISHEKCAEYVRRWANTFDSVISIQMTHDPSEETDLKFKYAVFGVWKNGTPAERTPDGAALKKGTEYIAERPMEDGTILYYRNTPEDVEKLIEFLRSEGVKTKKSLTAKHWLTTGTCTNKPQSEGGGCKNNNCSGGCSYCEPGHYCCC